MAKYRTTDAAAGQGLFITVNLKEQLLPGTLEHMLDELIGTTIDTSVFDKNYRNDQTGASAVPPAVLLKLIIYGYSKGCNSSRKLWNLSRENIVAKALTGDMDIHFTTIADFISGHPSEVQAVFTRILAYCNELGLIGGEMFAIDGLRLPSNASMEMSGTRQELEKRHGVYQRMAEKHLSRHQQKDELGEVTEETRERFEQQQKRLRAKIANLSSFLQTMEPKKGFSGREVKSNVTDNASAVIRSSKGYVQGYIGTAATDSKNQIIIHAQAVGSANEGEHLPELLARAQGQLAAASVAKLEGTEPVYMMDSNYFSEENLQACKEQKVQALIPDIHEKRYRQDNEKKRYEAGDFRYDETGNYYECPAGKKLTYRRTGVLGGREGKEYYAQVQDCRRCPLSAACMRSKKEPEQWKDGRSLFITRSNEPRSLCAAMREKMAEEQYQAIYAYRIQIAEPVFANIRHCKGLNRFTLRGEEKVNGQWQLYCMVHNLGKCLNELNRRRNTV